MKKLISTTVVAISLGVMSTPLVAEDTSTVPYKNKMLENLMKLGTSKKIENVECTALYLNHAKDDVVLNPEQAKFRIRAKDGSEVLLKCDTLSDIPEAELTPNDKRNIKDGSTHRLWVPKDPKKYAESELVWDLPKGSVNFAASKAVTVKIPLNP